MTDLNFVHLVPTPAGLFFSKNDPNDPRLGDIVKPADLTNEQIKANDFLIFGYPDDAGISLNGGRPGACDAPKTIRQFLYKMTPSQPLASAVYDIGDLDIRSQLEVRHENAKNLNSFLQKKEIKTISLGGGHDYGYADAGGFLDAYIDQDEKPIVINFDAHLDVRPTNNGYNSGTPFYRLLSDYENKFHFFEVGLQPQCNSLQHREWALAKGAQLYDLANIHSGRLHSLFSNPILKNIKKTTPVYVSFDIDCLVSSEAGGCSQSWATGLKLQECLDFISELQKKSNVRGLGIYEVSPPLDTDNRTSKAAALLMYHFLFETQA